MIRMEPNIEHIKAALDVERWWTQNGYSYTLIRNGKTKQVYMVSKNDVTMKFEITRTMTDSEENIRLFQRMFSSYTVKDV